MTNEPIITARGLTKTFTVKRTTVEAVRGLDLDVAPGELVAFLGPNGAGKSTSLRMLTTLLEPTSGSARVAGCDIRTDPAGVRARIGYIGQGTSGGHNQRVRDELLAQGAFHGMGRRETAARADELLESLDLAAHANRAVLGLSGGQKRRLDIALGLLHSPRLLFLDEPSTGLDPQSRANLWRHLLDLRRSHGTTLFVTTHYLEEADRFAERVLVMDRGQVIADDTAAALKTNLARDVATVGFADATDADEGAPIAARVFGTAGERIDPVTLEFAADHGDELVPVALRDLDAAGIAVRRVAVRQPTLDDVFLALTGRSLRDDSAESSGSPDASIEPSDTEQMEEVAA